MRFEQALVKGENLRIRFTRTAVQLCAHRLKLVEFFVCRQIGCVGDVISGAGKGVKRHDVRA